MPFRGGYGTYFRGTAGRDDVDPLASALTAFKGEWDASGERRKADQARQAEEERMRAAEARANEAQRLERERFEESKRQAVADELRRNVARQDELRREGDARNERRGQALMDAGYVVMPNLMGVGASLVRGSSKQEREDASAVNRQVAVAKALQGVNQGAALEETRGAAKALGIAGAETMSLGELRQRVKSAEDEREYRQSLGLVGARGVGTPAPVRVTEGERTAAALYDFATPAYQRLSQRLGIQADGTIDPAKGTTGGVGFRDVAGESLKGKWYTPDWLGNAMQSDEGQQTFDDLTSLVLATQYALSGKAVTESEARKLARDLVPQLGDKEGRRGQKVSNIVNRMRVLQRLGDRALKNRDAEVVPSGTDSTLDLLDRIGR